MMRMRDFLSRLDGLILFDPSRWPYRENLARATGFILCTAFIIHRIVRFRKYTGDTPGFLSDGYSGISGLHLTVTDWHWIMWLTVWVIETGIFTGYILAFMTRTDARSVAKGFMEVAFPIGVASLPVLITITPMNFREVWPEAMERISLFVSAHPFPGHDSIGQVLGNWESAFFCFLFLIIAGGAINLTGLLTLRRSFTIMSEARALITRGIYSIIRHPLYAGHFIMFLGYLLFHLYWYTVVLYVAFLAGQYLRARIEEEKISAVFPAYDEYRQKTGMFFPRMVRPDRNRPVKTR